MQAGRENEAGVRQRFIQQKSSVYSSIVVDESGLLVPPSHTHLGCSPDGLVWVDGKAGKVSLLEIKCVKEIALHPPPAHSDQMQASMWILQLLHGDNFSGLCFYVQFNDISDTMTVKEVEFESENAQKLMDKVTKIWHEEITPRLILQEAGRLDEKTLLPCGHEGGGGE